MNSVKQLFIESYASTADNDEIVEGVVRLLRGCRLTTRQVERVIEELNQCLKEK